MKILVFLLFLTILQAKAENDFKNPELSLMLCSMGENTTLAKRFEWTDWKKDPVSLQLIHESRKLQLTLTTLEDGLDLRIDGVGGFKLGTHSRGGGFSNFTIKYVQKNKSTNEAMQECLKNN